MKRVLNRFYALPLVLCLCASLGLAGCAKIAQSIGTRSPGNGSTASSRPTAMAPDDSGDAARLFAQYFTKVDQNPIQEDILYELWLAAMSTDEPTQDPGTTGSSAMQQLADKYAAIVADQGIHYIESSQMMGMDIQTEYWIKGNQFVKLEHMSQKVTLCDGESYIVYQLDDKKGTRYSRDDAFVSADITVTLRGMLASLAASPYAQQDDQKSGDFDCSVFFMDIEVLGMKGNTLYVDKNTGMIVKNAYGDQADSDKSMAVVVTKLDVGGFGDEVFTVPGDIDVTDG